MPPEETVPPETSQPAPEPPSSAEATDGQASIPETASDTPQLEAAPPEHVQPAGFSTSSLSARSPAPEPATAAPSAESSGGPTQTPVNENPTPQSERQTAQIPVNEPFGSKRDLWAKALGAIQNRKQKKLEKIMTLFASRTSITNDEVEKLLHVSDATATRYLSALEKQGKIKQVGKTGAGVRYEKLV